MTGPAAARSRSFSSSQILRYGVNQSATPKINVLDGAILPSRDSGREFDKTVGEVLCLPGRIVVRRAATISSRYVYVAVAIGCEPARPLPDAAAVNGLAGTWIGCRFKGADGP